MSEGVQLHFWPQDGDSEQSYLEGGSAYECSIALSDEKPITVRVTCKM